MSYNLFLDDDPSRIPHKLGWINLPLVEWIIVRSHEEFVEYIKAHGIPLRISFDHDLGDTAYKELFRANSSDKVINYNNIKEKSGYDSAKWLAQLCIDTNTPIPQYYLHTLNPIGRMNMFTVLENARMMLTKSKS